MSRKVKTIGSFVFQLLLFFLFLLTFSLLWAQNNYGNIGLDEIVFTLNMPLEGTAPVFINSYLRTALCPALLLFAAELALLHFPSKNVYSLVFSGRKRSRRLQMFPLRLPAPVWTAIIFLWFGGILFRADRSFAFFSWVDNQIHQSRLIEEEYVDPQNVRITFPQEKRNLICIYVESAESSAQDKANGGVFDTNYIPEMTRIARDNISFSQSDLIEGAAVAPACGWTIAGLVAETSGLPLKLFTYDDSHNGTDNAMRKYASFMPGATSLGEILEAEGYHNFFLAGSNFAFGGRTKYFTQHGNYEIWDYVSAKKDGSIPKDYKEWWGFEDEKLYAFAKEKLKMLAAKGQPFNFSMLTADTHHQNGYLCRLCPDTYDDRYSNVWACASAQLDAFLKWLEEQDFYENTTVVICGDHCSMDSDFYGDLTNGKHTGATVRKVYNAIVNSPTVPVRENNRKFTTLDMFPTVLASIGVQIEGERLGLGTNLFSDRPTLSEEYGYETLFNELNRKSLFYDNHILYP